MNTKIILFATIALFFIAWDKPGKSLTSIDRVKGKGVDHKKKRIEKNIAGEGTVSFKVNGSLVKTSGWNISLFLLVGQRGVNVTSNMHEDPRTVTINVNSLKAGTYSFIHGARTSQKPGIAYGGYRPDFIKKMMDSYTFESGSFTITSIDTIAHNFIGSFYGKVKNSKGQQLEITEGKVITGKLKPTVTPDIH